MKTTKIAYFPELNNLEIKTAADFFAQNITFENVDSLNWPTDFPYEPGCRFKIARSANSIFVHYKVEENHVKALYTNDQEPVWEDSCVEFFCKLPEQDFYYNFEFNCIGTCIATQREGRDKNVKPFSTAAMHKIKRYASLGNSKIDKKEEKSEWTLTVEIPFELIGIQPNKIPEKLQANFYKCGDQTAVPHFLSWSPISTNQPDFHRPECFGEIYFHVSSK